MREYKILEILHSGRKGIRLDPVTEEKYNGMVDNIVRINKLENVKEFESIRMYIKHHPLYDFWDTSAIIGLSYSLSEHKYYLETINTIYVLQELEEY